MSLCTLVTTRFIRYLRVTSVNGLALQNESVYLSGCWDQSLSGSDLSKWPSSAKWVRVPQLLLASIVIRLSNLGKWPVSAQRVCLTHCGYWVQSVYEWVISVNGLALQNESVNLSGCWDQSLSGTELTVVTEFNRYMNDVSKWPVSSPGVWVPQCFSTASISIWVTFLVNGLAHESMYLSGLLLRSIGIWEWFSKWLTSD